MIHISEEQIKIYGPFNVWNCFNIILLGKFVNTHGNSQKKIYCTDAINLFYIKI